MKIIDKNNRQKTYHDYIILVWRLKNENFMISIKIEFKKYFN